MASLPAGPTAPAGGAARRAGWGFARRPGWVLSHAFALAVVTSFLLLGRWQLSRHHDRVEANAVLADRSAPPALDLGAALDRPVAELDLQRVQGHGRYVDDDVVRVANRSQGGVAGQHVVATFRLDDGRLLLVNRGFAPLDPDGLTPAPSGPVTVEGWLRPSVAKGRFGATDPGTGTVVPRLDVAAIEGRLDEPVAPVWLQLAGASGAGPAAFPDPVPLEDLGNGPHLGYAAQWWTFAALGTAFYLALLRRTARQAPRSGTDRA